MLRRTILALQQMNATFPEIDQIGQAIKVATPNPRKLSMPTLIAEIDGATHHLALDTIQESPATKEIVLRAARFQPKIPEDQITHVLFDMSEASLTIEGDDTGLVANGVAQGQVFSLITANGHSISIGADQFL